MVIADSGFFIALASDTDRHHARARAVSSQLGEPLISTWPVVTETCHMLLHRVGGDSQQSFVASLARGAVSLFPLDARHARHLSALIGRYADLPMDLADASLVVLAEHLGHGRILSTDRRDFSTYRWKQYEPFENLLLSF